MSVPPPAASISAIVETTGASTFDAPRPSYRRGALAAAAASVVVVLIVASLVAMAGRGRSPPETARAPVASASISLASHAPAGRVAPALATSAPSTPPAPSASSEPVTSEPLTLKPGEAELTVVCTPVPCTTIMVDRQPFVSDGVPKAMPAGTHGVGVSRPGYGGQWQLTKLRDGERAKVEFLLTPVRVAAPKKPCGKFLQRCD
jgi:hypothetical protein